MAKYMIWLALLAYVGASSIEDPEVWNNLKENYYIPPSLKELFLEHKPDEDVDRIVGGQVAPPNAFPHQVGLGLTTTTGQQSWCGGSIISERFIVTAAHCMDNIMYATVMLGGHDRENPAEPGRVTVRVSMANFIVHSGWNAQRMIHDIALIKLPTPITFTDKIKPVALPTRTHAAMTFEGHTATISGWGRDESGQLSRLLKFTKTPVVSNNICQRYFGQMVHSSNICLDGSQARGTCHGDSGGPLIIDTTEGTVIVGLTSFGNPYNCQARWPTAYTRVSSYLSWISMNTGIPIRN